MRYALLVLLVSLSVVACANDAAVNGVGGAIAPMGDHPSIRMVREKVDARVGWDGVKVRCEFVFKNEGSATTVKMGFPERSWGDSARPITKTEFESFRSWVDGKPVETKLVPSSKDQSGEYEAWHVKDVRFGPGQTRTVVDEYTSFLGGMSDGERFFSYVLVTGRSWKGTIGEAIVIVDASEVAGFYKVARPPDESKGFVQKGNTVTWRAKDFEPTEDIDVGLVPWKLMIEENPGYISDPRLFAEKGITMAHVQELETIEGCRVSWDGSLKECRVEYRSHSLRMKVGSTKATLDGKSMVLPAAPRIEWSSLQAPVDVVAKKLSMKVTRDTKARWVTIQR